MLIIKYDFKLLKVAKKKYKNAMTSATREEAPRHFSISVMKSYVFTLCNIIITLFELFVILCSHPPTSRQINHKRKKISTLLSHFTPQAPGQPAELTSYYKLHLPFEEGQI